LTRGEQLLQKWEQIPTDTDILLTHTPALGHGDVAAGAGHVGCAELLTTIQQRVRPQVGIGVTQ
jgi:Icc-related predicted phosphoesterase